MILKKICPRCGIKFECDNNVDCNDKCDNMNKKEREKLKCLCFDCEPDVTRKFIMNDE